MPLVVDGGTDESKLLIFKERINQMGLELHTVQ